MTAADKPAIPDVLDRFVAYFHADGNSVWGSLHCVLDDGNVSNSDVEHAIVWATERGDLEGEALGRILLKMSRTQRLKLPEAVNEAIEAASRPGI